MVAVFYALAQTRMARQASALQSPLPPTPASWMNPVERFFAETTRKRIRRGALASVAKLEAAIDDYLLHHNASAKPLVWTKSADTIIRKRASLP